MACGKTDSSVVDPGRTEEQAESEDFDPSTYPKACAVDADCVLVTALGSCYSCCGAIAVRADSTALADEDHVRQVCAKHGGEGSCFMACGTKRAACANHECHVEKVDAGP